MNGTFHWLKAQTFCYATEKEDLLTETMTALLGTEELDKDISEGEHGNKTVIIQRSLEKQKEVVTLFTNLGEDVISDIIDDIDNRVDEDCTFFLRLDKQKAVEGVYAIAHHGDVIALTGKVVSHPARKEVAIGNLKTFLVGLL